MRTLKGSGDRVLRLYTFGGMPIQISNVYLYLAFPQKDRVRFEKPCGNMRLVQSVIFLVYSRFDWIGMLKLDSVNFCTRGERAVQKLTKSANSK